MNSKEIYFFYKIYYFCEGVASVPEPKRHKGRRVRKTSSSIATPETSVEQKDSFGDLFGLTPDSATSITSSRSSGYQSQPDFTSEG